MDESEVPIAPLEEIKATPLFEFEELFASKHKQEVSTYYNSVKKIHIESYFTSYTYFLVSGVK